MGNTLEAYRGRSCFGRKGSLPSDRKHHPHATKPYSYDDWEEMREWSLRKKIKWSRKILYVELRKAEKPVVSFSGGKSSEVALHLTLSLYDVEAVYNDTRVTYPETKSFVEELSEEWGFDLTITEPRKTFWECVDEYGWPETRTGGGTEPRCCYWLKMEPMKRFVRENGIDLFITGEQASESMQRRANFLLYGESFKYRKWSFKDRDLRKAKPVSIWTDDDIWSYLKEHNLPVNPAYEKYDIDRTGCIPCTGFDGWEEKMRKFSPSLYKRVKREKDGLRTLEDFS